ncbi:pilin [Patescibacteria group bacterium]
MFKQKKFILLFLILLFLCVGINPSLTQARDLEVDYPSFSGEEGGFVLETVEKTELPDYVKYIFNFAIAIVGFVAFGMMLANGIQYLTSTGNLTKIKKARDGMFGALLGVVILFSSYIILTTINPQLVIFEGAELEVAELGTPPPEGLQQITSSIEVEIPPGTIIEKRIFSIERLKRIKLVTASTVEVAIGPVVPNASSTSESIKLLTDECNKTQCHSPDVKPCICDGSCELKIEPECRMVEECTPREVCNTIETCEQCIVPAGIGCLVWDPVDPDDCDFLDCVCTSTEECYEEEDCTESEECTDDVWCESLTENPCQDIHCESDPCNENRGEITNKKNENNDNNIERFLRLQEDNYKEIIELNVELEKLKKSLKKMWECPMWGIIDMTEYLSSKDTYITEGWKLKSVPYWEEINNVNLNPVTFYCPAGGTIGFGPDFLEIDASTTEQYLEAADEYFQEHPKKEELQSVCSRYIPLGEIFDYSASTTLDLIFQMEKLLSLNEKIIKDIDLFHRSVSSGCTSLNCTTDCDCELIYNGTGEPTGCECRNESLNPGTCNGTPCTDINVSEIKETAEEIKKTRDEIYRIIDEEIPKIINNQAVNNNSLPDGLLVTAKKTLPLYIFENLENPGLFVRDCESAIGNIGGSGDIIEKPSDCQCEKSEGCKINFEFLRNYKCSVFDHKGDDTLLDLLSNNCLTYNFFGCLEQE